MSPLLHMELPCQRSFPDTFIRMKKRSQYLSALLWSSYALQSGYGGRGGGRKSGMGRGRGRGGVRHQPDYWSLAQPEFRLWLSNITTKAEYNKLPIAERRELLRDFGISHQRSDGELQGLLQRFLASHADPYFAVSASHYSRDDSESAKAASITYYGLSNEKFCQVLGAVDPNRVNVINAHIWPRSAAQDLILFDLQPAKIHDERKVLRLQKDIERAFDHRELTFVENDAGALVVKVINPAILSETLTGTTMTFNDIQGTPLLLPSGGSSRLSLSWNGHGGGRCGCPKRRGAPRHRP